ncbi:hypothetical protein GQR58_013563 [Nymphon striatum]|nr:hypothetical protein GQR58_013563 [Nymphon striatum]
MNYLKTEHRQLLLTSSSPALPLWNQECPKVVNYVELLQTALPPNLSPSPNRPTYRPTAEQSPDIEEPPSKPPETSSQGVFKITDISAKDASQQVPPDVPWRPPQSLITTFIKSGIYSMGFKTLRKYQSNMRQKLSYIFGKKIEERRYPEAVGRIECAAINVCGWMFHKNLKPMVMTDFVTNMRWDLKIISFMELEPLTKCGDAECGILGPYSHGRLPWSNWRAACGSLMGQGWQNGIRLASEKTDNRLWSNWRAACGSLMGQRWQNGIRLASEKTDNRLWSNWRAACGSLMGQGWQNGIRLASEKTDNRLWSNWRAACGSLMGQGWQNGIRLASEKTDNRLWSNWRAACGSLMGQGWQNGIRLASQKTDNRLWSNWRAACGSLMGQGWQNGIRLASQKTDNRLWSNWRAACGSLMGQGWQNGIRLASEKTDNRLWSNWRAACGSLMGQGWQNGIRLASGKTSYGGYIHLGRCDVGALEPRLEPSTVGTSKSSKSSSPETIQQGIGPLPSL